MTTGSRAPCLAGPVLGGPVFGELARVFPGEQVALVRENVISVMQG
jgi:hypothetical protein